MILFETERLVIRELEEDDADRMAEYRSKREVAQYQSWTRFTRKDALKLIHYVHRYPFRKQRYDMLQLAVTLRGAEMIGDLHVTMSGMQSITIGYTFDSLYWHQGYAREAVGALLDYMAETYQIKKANAYIMTYNDASRRLLLDLGFSKFDDSWFFKEESYTKILIKEAKKDGSHE